MEFNGYVRMAEASRRMGISKARIRKLCQEGRVPDVRKFAGEWLIPVAYADSYVKSSGGRPKKQSELESDSSVRLLVANSQRISTAERAMAMG